MAVMMELSKTLVETFCTERNATGVSRGMCSWGGGLVKGSGALAGPAYRFFAASTSGSISKPSGLPAANFCRALTIAASSPGGVWFFHQFMRSL